MRISFVDISSPDFDEEKYGLVGQPYKLLFTAKDNDNNLFFGLDTFIKILEVIEFKLVAFVLKIPGIYSITKLFYFLYAKNRSRLAKLFTKNCNDTCDLK